MADEEVVAVAPGPAPSDNKRKLEELDPQPEAPEQAEPCTDEPADSNAELDGATEHGDVALSDESDAKRPRLGDKPDGLGILLLATTRSLSLVTNDKYS